MILFFNVSLLSDINRQDIVIRLLGTQIWESLLGHHKSFYFVTCCHRMGRRVQLFRP